MWNGDINDIKEVVIYINLELAKGRTLKDIEINDFKVNDRVIAKRLSRKGYKRIQNRFVLTNLDEEKHTKVIKEKKRDERNHTKVIKENEHHEDKNVDQLKVYDESMLRVIENKKLEKNLLNLLMNHDKIMKLIDRYDDQYDDRYDNKENSIIIELPIETKSDFRTTIRVNNVIWEQFNEFASKHSEFTKRDLISMSLKLYMDQFK